MQNYKENNQKSLLLAPRQKIYIAPWSGNIPIEATPLLAASGPGANVKPIEYGGNLFEEDIDDD